MLDTRRSDPNCSFAEDIVSFLYDEMGSGEKLNFQQHLHSCLSCGEELAAFTAVSTSVQNWRDAEFADVPTPAIALTYDAPTVYSAGDPGDLSKSWLSNLWRSFDLSSGYLKTAAAFGVLVIFIGSGLFFLRGSIGGGVEVANTPQNNSNPAAVNEVLSPGNRESSVDDPSSVTELAESSKSTSKVELPETNVEPIRSSDPTRQRSVNRGRRSSAANSRIKDSSSTVVRKPAQKNISAPDFKENPRLTEEVAIDDSEELRLSDIFSEIGS